MNPWPLHGRDPEPLQRPRLAGAIAAAAAALPAAALVWWTGAAAPPAAAIHLRPLLLVLLSIAGLVVAGGLYGAVFLRAANDHRGGWLFGLGWGFLSWAVGPITLCQWFLVRPIATGNPAAILLAAHLLWGLLLGVLFPLVESRTELSIENAPSPRQEGLDRRDKGGKARDHDMKSEPPARHK